MATAPARAAAVVPAVAAAVVPAAAAAVAVVMEATCVQAHARACVARASCVGASGRACQPLWSSKRRLQQGFQTPDAPDFLSVHNLRPAVNATVSATLNATVKSQQPVQP